MAGRRVRGRFTVRRSLRQLLASTTVGLFLALVPVEVVVDEGGVSDGEPESTHLADLIGLDLIGFGAPVAGGPDDAIDP